MFINIFVYSDLKKNTSNKEGATSWKRSLEKLPFENYIYKYPKLYPTIPFHLRQGRY